MKPSAVVLRSASNYVPKMGAVEPSHPITKQGWGDGLGSTIRYLSEHGICPVIMRDVPDFAYDIPTCLSRAAQPPTSVVSVRMVRAERAAVRMQGASYVDLTPAFCGARCIPMLDTTSKYQDDAHISVA